MAHYDIKILSALLDSYENSLLSKGENKVNIHIAFPFTKKTLPEYFNESSLAYDDIHAAVNELERKDFLSVVWKKGKSGHIIQKVILKEEHIDKVYSYLKRTPKADYVYIKGEGELSFHKGSKAVVELACLEQGIGISGDDVENIKVSGKGRVRKVITIENLTTFFRWWEKNSLIIYLGGYHNSVRRELLNRVYQELPDAEYLHFGDIDIGGFEIYRDLCEKTGIPFQTYHMGIWELKQYEDYTKRLTENDKKRLQALKKNGWFGQRKIMQVLEYMEEKDMKLEQEVIRKN